MTYRFYGQNGEDYLLWHFFDFKNTGFFLDVGAHDGIALSNTKSFEEQGWAGICVEPIPEMFDACKKVRARVVNAACISGPDRSITLRVDRTGLFAGIRTDENHATKKYKEWGSGDPEFQSIKVPAVRAAELIAPGDPPIDFASIDVEGTEIDVLKGLNLSKNRPRVLALEALTEKDRDDLDYYLKEFDYIRARSVYWNHFYVTTEKDARKIRSLTIDCQLTVPTIAGFGRAKMVERAWQQAETDSRIGFLLAKIRHHYRRRAWGV